MRRRIRIFFVEMGQLGFVEPMVIDGYGCAGIDYVCYGLIAKIESVDSGYRSVIVQCNPSLVYID